MNTPVRRKMLRRKQVEVLLGISRSTIYKRLHDDPTFPRPVNLGPSRAVVWLEDEITGWLETQIARRPEFGRGDRI